MARSTHYGLADSGLIRGSQSGTLPQRIGRGYIRHCSTLSLGPHNAYFRMPTLKPQVAKAATVASVIRDK